MPLPRSTRTSPGCAPAGSSSSTGPSSVSTVTVDAECRLRRSSGRPARRCRSPRARSASSGRTWTSDVDVARAAAERARMPLAGEADALAVVDPGRNVDVERCSSSVRPAPRHVSHGCSTICAAAPAIRARRRADELAEEAARDLLQPAAAAAARTGPRLRAGLDAVAAARLAGRRHLERHLDRRAARCSRRARSRSPPRRPRRALRGGARAAAEEVVAEERGEEIAEAADVEVRRREAAGAEPGVAVAVVERAPLGVREHLVRLGHLAEADLRLRLARDVGMQLAREPPERLLDRRRRRRRAGRRAARSSRDRWLIGLVARRPLRRSATARRRPSADGRAVPSRSPCATARAG